MTKEEKLIQMLNTSSPSAIEKYFENERLKKMPKVSAKFSIVVQTMWLDAGFNEIDRETIPDVLKSKIYPFPIFGAFDYFSEFAYFRKKTGYDLAALTPDKFRFLELGIYDGDVGVSEDQINKITEVGDLLLVASYLDSQSATGYFYIMSVHCDEMAYGSLLNNINFKNFFIKNLKFSFIAVTDTQLSVPLEILTVSDFGRTSSDSFNFNAFRKPLSSQGQIVDINYQGFVNRYLMWYYGFWYDCEQLQFDFQVEYFDFSRPELKFNISEHKQKCVTSKFSGHDHEFFD